MLWQFDFGIIRSHSSDQRRKGYIGEDGSKPGKMEDYKSSFDRLRGQRLPYAIFFGYFLAWWQKSDPADVCVATKNQLFESLCGGKWLSEDVEKASILW